jgi:hypothetical protein
LHNEHPDGTRIQIVGNADAPDKVRLVWPSHTDGIDVRGGQVLGRLDGVTLFREIPGGNDNGANDNAVGLLAENSGVLLAGPAVVVDGFYYGAQARYGGVMRLHGVTVRHAGDAGFFAYNGGHIDAQQARAEDVSDSKLGLGSGFVADGATASENRRYGFYAITNGSIVAHHPKLLKNGIKPSQAEQGGSISGMEP